MVDHEVSEEEREQAASNSSEAAPEPAPSATLTADASRVSRKRGRPRDSLVTKALKQLELAQNSAPRFVLGGVVLSQALGASCRVAI